MDIEGRYGIGFKFSCTTLRSSRRRPDLGVRNSWVSCGYIGVKCFGDTQGKHLLPTKVHIVKSLVFPVVMYGCESWTTKLSAEELMFLKRRLLRVPWTARGSVHPKGNQSWIFIGRIDAEAETPTLWPPDAKNWLIWKDPDARKDWRQEEKGDDRGWDGWMASSTQWAWVWVSSGSWWWTGKPGILQSMGSQRVRHNWANELNWTEWNHQVASWHKGQELSWRLELLEAMEFGKPSVL